MWRLCVIFLLSWLSLSIKAWDFKTGDLIFLAEGKGAFSKAISDATATSDSLKFVHVGIIEVDSLGHVNVIEASPEEGVRIIGFEKFTPDSVIYVVKRLSIAFDAEGAVKRAKEHLGEPYDWWYLPSNDRMYCSELVYESYLDEAGRPIFEARPMNFRRPDGTMPEFWIELFNELGEEVPEGIPGTNPADLSRDSRLVIVNREFV